MAAPSSRRAPWRGCLFASLGLHAGLLLLSPLATGLSPGGPSPGQPRALMVRQIDAGRVMELAAAEPAPLHRLAPLALQADAPPPARLAAPLTPQPPLTPLTPPSAEPGDDAVYLPRRQLDEPPRALESIDLPWPADGPPDGRYGGIVSLFIDEAGVVQRVRLDEAAALPPSFGAVVQEVFLRARFSPGQLHGRPVRAWIRIEVSFIAPGASSARGVRLQAP